MSKETENKSQMPDPKDSGFPFYHTYPLQIRFNDIDTLGHVNNSVYFPFFDLGKARYFETVMAGAVDWKRVDVVIANINCNFWSPIFFSEPIEVQTQVVSVKNTSFKVFQRLVNTETGEVKCTCTTIMVGFDIVNQTSWPLSETWVNALNKFEKRELRQEKI